MPRPSFYSIYIVLVFITACSKTERPEGVPSKDKPMEVYALGQAALAQGDNARAIVLFQEVLLYDSSFQEARVALGLAAALAKQEGLAVRAFSDALLLTPTLDPAPYPKAFVQLQLGLLYQSLGQPALAESHLKQAVMEDPAFAEASFKLGEFLFKKQAYAEAAASFSQALHNQPGDTTALLFLAKIAEQAKDPVSTEHWLRKAAFYEHSSSEAKLELARFLFHKNRPQEAFEALHSGDANAKPEGRLLYQNILKQMLTVVQAEKL